ncbi:MFS transporter [Streptomyces orinoci]|uniref:MFS transporter n=1 Tax=Streptomyces orinoci TaxID=67339 RepID=A0ABV3K1D6_STRON|nr:MFS transporter [Streptomyces orinoci]
MATGSPARGRAILGVACAGMFMTQLDSTLVNVALGAVKSEFSAPTTTVTWVVDAYLVTFAASLLGLGVLGDRLGRKRTYLTGLALFAATSAGCTLVPGIGWLIALRAGQGVAAACVLVTSLAVLLDWFAAEDRPRVIGWWAAVAGISLAVGPVLGGVIVDGLGWRWVFWLHAPVALLGLALGPRTLRESYGPRRPLDWRGQLLAAAALASLTWGITTGAGSGWTRPLPLLLLTLAPLLAGAFVLVESRSTAPLVPLHLFRSHRFAATNLAAALVSFGTMGLLFLISAYMVQIAVGSATAAGLSIVPLFVAHGLASPFSGTLQKRWGSRIVTAVGCALAAASTWCVAASLGNRPVMTVALLTCGAGVGVGMSALVAAAVAAAPADAAGLASGLNNTARQMGSSVAVALLGGLIAAATTPRDGVRLALAVDGTAYLLAAALTLSLRKTHASRIIDAPVNCEDHVA